MLFLFGFHDARIHDMGSNRHAAFSIVEVVVALLAIGILLAVLLPGLSAARSASYREVCADNQRLLGEAWFAYMTDHNDTLPMILSTPGWQYGGCRFSVATGEHWLDPARPLNQYVSRVASDVEDHRTLFHCPADRGIRGGAASNLASDIGTGDRTAFRAFGTSYRANHWLMSARAAGLMEPEDRPLARSEILSSPARLVLLGDPTWYESYMQTGRTADWHGKPGHCNLLFMDGSVRYRTVNARGMQSPITFEPELFPEDLRDIYGPAR